MSWRDQKNSSAAFSLFQLLTDPAGAPAARGETCTRAGVDIDLGAGAAAAAVCAWLQRAGLPVHPHSMWANCCGLLGGLPNAHADTHNE